jgi:Flp pilus assembly protein TadG
MKVRNEEGAVAVEFALLAPLLVIILFAIVSFGIALTRTVAYVSAAREGARYAAVHCRPDATQCTSALIITRVTDSANGYPIGPGVPTADTDCTITPGEPVTVSWDQDVPIQVPFLPDFSWTLAMEGTFRCE